MSGHKQIVELCQNTCDAPYHVDVCGLPAATTCVSPVSWSISNVDSTTIGGAGHSWTLESSGPTPTILYTFPSLAAADNFERIITNGVAWSSQDGGAARLTWPVTGTSEPLPSTWNAAGVQYERVSTTTSRVTWIPTAFAEGWASTALGSPSPWLNALVVNANEGTTYPWTAGTTFQAQRLFPATQVVEVLPVSIPCGVALTNAEELADAIAGRIPGPAASTGGTAVVPAISSLSSTRTTFAAAAAVSIAATLIPTNARSVTVWNDTRAAIAFTVSAGAPGTHHIPPYSTHTITLPDNSSSFSGTWAVASVQGNAGPLLQGGTINPSISVDWVTRTP